jgi:GNAT superfamily N-acetyltransferase
MKDISLRQATAVDAEAIHELHLNSVRVLCASSYKPGIIGGWLKGRTPAGYLRGIAAGAIFVAEVESKRVGFCEAVPGEVVVVFVDPQSSRKGVGSALLSRALDVSAGTPRPVRLESTLNAVSFCECFSFRQITRSSVRRNEVDVPVVIMERHAG